MRCNKGMMQIKDFFTVIYEANDLSAKYKNLEK